MYYAYVNGDYLTNVLFIHCVDEGNVYLRNGEVSQAIDCYDKALKLGTYYGLLLLLQTINRSNNEPLYTIYIHVSVCIGDKEQEGVLLVMRGTALLQRAYVCRMVSII